jgi:hypothetical protein
MRALLLCILSCLISQQGFALRGACGNRDLPSGKTREARNIHLECASSKDSYVRRPIPFDVNAWRRLEKLKKRDEMQALRQEEPQIKWSGAIPYNTVEVWEWTDWVFGADPVCGYDTVEHTDANGDTYTTEEMRSCWHDEDQYEVRHCSAEVMKYNANFIRPGKSEWNPKTVGYYDVIPNKYDLLPGEIEVIQLFNTSGRSRTIDPYGQVGDAWNEYEFIIAIMGHGRQAPCRFNHTYEMDVLIKTVKRLTDKASPNAFRLPVDRHGRQTDPLSWLETLNSDNEYVRSKPDVIKLSDASSTIITSMARQTRKFETEIQKAKNEAGVGESASDKDSREHKEESGFWKDTRVRLQLFEVIWLGRDRRVTHNMYTSGSEVAMGEHYKMGLMGSATESDMYRASGPYIQSIWEQFKFNLRPKTEYEFRISMYQKNVPFYAQDCETDPGWDCKTIGRPESKYYSKELPIPFGEKTNEYVDERSFLQKLSDFQGRIF